MNSYFQHTLYLSSYASHQKYKCFNKNILITFVFRIFSIYLHQFQATAVAKKDFTEKVLLKLSSTLKLRNFDY